MKTIKSFSDFENSDNHVDEQLFKRAIEKKREKKALKKADSEMNVGASDRKIRGVRGKEVYRDAAGVKHKVVWKAQDSTNFIVKLVRDYNWLDSDSNLTLDGQTALTQYLSGENAFVNQYGRLDQAFFTKNIIAYSVVIDTDRRQKIQFTILNREELSKKADLAATDGKEYINLDGVNYINVKAIMSIDAEIAKKQQSLSNTIVNIEDDTQDDTQDDSQVDDTTDDTQDDDQIDDIPLEDVDLKGKKFEYQSGADGLLYIITIDRDEDGNLKFWAKSKDGSREGWVVLKNGEPFWISKDGTSTAITNAKDVDFFKRIYTDMEYLKQLIAEFEAKYPNGADWTIKDILFYSNGDRIYQDAPAPTGSSLEKL